MKSLKILILVLLLIVNLSSCTKKFLNSAPEDQLSEPTFWKSEDDVLRALAGVYNGWESSNNLMYLDGASDNGYNCFSWRGAEFIASGETIASTTVGNNLVLGFYSYGPIRRANYFLEKVDLVPSMDETRKKVYKAEVRFLRAYDYYRKVIWFGGVPLVKKVIEKATESNVARSSEADIVNFVLTELAEVAQILPDNTAAAAKGHATKGAALALKARLELYKGKYTDAMADAKAIMALGTYKLNPDFKGTFSESNERNSEVIMDIEYIKDTYPAVNQFLDLNPGRDGGNNGISSQQSLVDAFESKDGIYPASASPIYDPLDPFKNRDSRLDNSVLYTGKLWNGRYLSYTNPLKLNGSANQEYAPSNAGSRTGYGIHKYNRWIAVADKNNGGYNWIVFRYAEVLLTFAEASIEANQINNDLYAALDLIRLRSGMPAVDRTKYNSQVTLRELVRRERRVELAWEGLRYQDIKRYDIGATALNGPVVGSWKGILDETTGKVTWDFTQNFFGGTTRIFKPERKYLMPIPQTEVDANTAISTQDQNPGY
jgi:hypothetical protein